MSLNCEKEVDQFKKSVVKLEQVCSIFPLIAVCPDICIRITSKPYSNNYRDIASCHHSSTRTRTASVYDHVIILKTMLEVLFSWKVAFGE